jgi:hypothetical protein
MSSDFSDRLNKIAERKAASDQIAHEAKAVEQKREAEQENQQMLAKNRWNQRELSMLRRTVFEINARLKPSAIALDFEDDDSPDDKVIGRAALRLIVNGRPKRSTVLFNMTGLGKIQISHTPSFGGPTKQTSADTFDEETLRGLLVDFIEQGLDSDR